MEYKEIRRNIGYSTINRFIFTIRGLLVLPIITQFIGVSEFGAWVYFSSIIGLTVGIVGFHSQGILIRFLSGEQDIQTFIDVIVLSLLTASIVSPLFYISVVNLDIFSTISKVPHNDRLLLAISYLIFIRLIWKPVKAYPRAKEQIKDYEFLRASRGILETIILPVVLVYTQNLAYGFWAIGLSYTSLIVYTYMKFIPKGITQPRISKFSTYLSYGVPVMMSNVWTESLKDADKYLIAYFLTANALGVYGVAYRIAQLLTSITAVLRSTLYPAITTAWDQDNILQIENIYSTIFASLIIIFPPAIVGLWSVSMPIFQLLTDNIVYYNTRLLMLLLAIGISIKSIGDVTQYILTASKDTQLIAKVSTGAAVVNIILNIVLITTVGLIGAAISTIIGYMFGSMLYCYFCFNYIDLNLGAGIIWRSTTAAIFMGMILSFINVSSPEVELLVKVVFGICLYGLTTYVLNGFRLPVKEISFRL